MAKRPKLYDYTDVYDRRKEQMLSAEYLIAEDKKIILKFDTSLKNNRTSLARRVNLMEKLMSIRKNYLKKPFTKSTNKKEIEKFCDNINNDSNIRERTRSDYKAILKQFYRWHNNDILPDYVAWIRRKQLKDDRQISEKTKEDLLTDQEQKKLLNATKCKRDYAMIKLAIETGMRPNELLRLKLKHIDFDEQNTGVCMVTVPSDTKTGSRKIPIVASVKALKDYINTEHPGRDNTESYLWVQQSRYRTEPLQYKGYSDLLRNLKLDAKINKRFHAYIFRYTSYTNKARAGWSEQKIKTYHGLAKDSKMLSVYVKMEADELIDDVLELAGKKVIKRSEKKKQYVVCPRCDEENEFDKKRCTKCGMILDLEEAQKQAEKKDKEAKSIKEQLDEMRSMMNEISKREGIASKGFARMKNPKDKAELKSVIKEMIKKGELEI